MKKNFTKSETFLDKRMILFWLLLGPRVVCDSFMISNKVWRKTYVSSSVLEPGKAEMLMSEPTNHLMKCNMKANEMKWAHLMCYRENICYLSEHQVLPSFSLKDIKNPVECMTDQEITVQHPKVTITAATTAVTTTAIATTTTTTTTTTTIETSSVMPTTTRPLLDMKYFFVVINPSFANATADCIARGGIVYVPKTEEEYGFYKYWSVEIQRTKAWYPLSDNAEEGTEVYSDGTLRQDNPFEPPMQDWDLISLNTVGDDCVIYTLDATLKWELCLYPLNIGLLCQDLIFASKEASRASTNVSSTNATMNATETPRPELTATNFFLVNDPFYHVAKEKCLEKYGIPFVPKSEVEYDYFMKTAVDIAGMFAWYPLHDFEKEGVEIYSDGTLRKDNPFEPPNWDPSAVNIESCDCVSYGSELLLKWSSCAFPLTYNLLCQRL